MTSAASGLPQLSWQLPISTSMTDGRILETYSPGCPPYTTPDQCVASIHVVNASRCIDFRVSSIDRKSARVILGSTRLKCPDLMSPVVCTVKMLFGAFAPSCQFTMTTASHEAKWSLID